MKNFLKESWFKILVISILLFSFISSTASAVSVRGYYRKNGTYVQPYTRTAPDKNPYNNYSYPGNYNPNTGKITPGNPNTYLKNYYNKETGTIAPSVVVPAKPTVTTNDLIISAVEKVKTEYYKNTSWFREKLITNLTNSLKADISSVAFYVYTMLPDVK